MFRTKSNQYIRTHRLGTETKDSNPPMPDYYYSQLSENPRAEIETLGELIGRDTLISEITYWLAFDDCNELIDRIRSLYNLGTEE